MTTATLTISNTLSLAGTAFMELDKSVPTNDSVRVTGTVTYCGGADRLRNRQAPTVATATTTMSVRIHLVRVTSGNGANLRPAPRAVTCTPARA